MFGYEVLFVHGAGAGPWVWAPWAAYLASEGWAVRSLTLPGHAPGDGEPRHGLEDYVRYLAGSVDRPEKTILFGHSMGGWVCLKYMETQRVSASLLVAPLPIDGAPGRTRRGLARLAPGTGLKTVLLGRPAQLPDESVARALLFLPSTPEAIVHRHWEKLVPESARAIRQMAWMRLTGLRVRPRSLARAQAGVPHRVFASPDDFFFRPDELRETAEALGATLEEHPGYPHCMIDVDEDRALVRRADDWLRTALGVEPRGTVPHESRALPGDATPTARGV